MRVVILGQGAIGSLLAGLCEQLQIDYAVMPRTGRCQARTVHFVNGQQRTFTPDHITAQQLRGDELLLLPLKAFQIVPALQHIKSCVSHQTLVLLNNGMGVIEDVQALLPDQPLIASISKKAVLKQGSQVHETGTGETALGWQTQGATDSHGVERLLNSVLTPCRWYQDLRPALWQKLAINAVINPLTALHNIKNGELAGAEYAGQIQHLCDETRALMARKGITGWQGIGSAVKRVIRDSAQNYSSMHQDIAHHRATEIDYINGYLVKEGKQHGLPMSAHHRLWQQIRAREPATTQAQSPDASTDRQ